LKAHPIILTAAFIMRKYLGLAGTNLLKYSVSSEMGISQLQCWGQICHVISTQYEDGLRADISMQELLERGQK